MITFLSFLFYNLYNAPVDGFEEKFIYLLKQYGYVILFVWSMLEGEMGLIMAGLMAHDGSMNLFLAIFIAGLGGFAGDQVYFYIGRFNKDGVLKKIKRTKKKVCICPFTFKKTWLANNFYSKIYVWNENNYSNFYRTYKI